MKIEQKYIEWEYIFQIIDVIDFFFCNLIYLKENISILM